MKASARLPFTLLVTAVLTCLCTSAQDFSNKGKEFWLAYCYHVGMVNGGGTPTMTLYLTSDVATTYNVEVYGGTNLQSGSIAPGQVVTADIPSTYFINDEGVFTNKAIRVTAANPIVVYSYITRSQASGATLCLPTAVLGKEYYSMNFTQVSNEPNSNSYITIVAVDDNTTVEITPSANTKNGWVANGVYTVNLNKGQIYQVLGALDGPNATTGVDLTGTHVRSISSGTGGCKKIAVFSGSGKVRIPQSCNATSSDNLYQQLYPMVSWGKKYLTAPSANNPNNYYRIAKSDPAAKVYVNGVPVPASSFNNGIWYQFFNKTPNLIESDLPISVTQYFTTEGCDGNMGMLYDPDMIVLNPVEQNISKVTLVNPPLANPTPPYEHHLQILIPNAGTGISSFRLDGAAVNNTWTVHPSAAAYSYIYLDVNEGYHTLSSDSGFNALAYGFASAESYGYSAGANVKDLYQFMSVRNQYATVNFPAGCKNSPLFFSITFPYQPTDIQWIFGTALNSMGIADTTINSPVYDSTWTINGRQVYKYDLLSPYTLSAAGTYPVQVVAQNPSSDGCSGDQVIDYDLQVFDPPVVSFSFNSNGCLTDSVHFLGTVNTSGRNIISYSWDFGDGNMEVTQNAVHLYQAANSYPVKYSVITDIGCFSDTVQQTVPISLPPVANFAVSTPACENKILNFTDQSSASSGPPITKWTWNFGDGSLPVISTTGDQQPHSYLSPGTDTASLLVETASGCKSFLFSQQIIVGAFPVVNFKLPESCLNDPFSSFIDSSSIADGTENLLVYNWDFGDANSGNSNTSTLKDPQHKYTNTGSYNVSEITTSNIGCASSVTKTFFVNGSIPVPSFSIQESASVCSGSAIHLTDNSVVNPGNIIKLEIYWDHANDPTAKTIDDEPSAGKIYTYTYPALNSSASKNVIIRYVAYSGQTCAEYVDKTITLLPTPALQFDALNGVCGDAPAFQITGTTVTNGLPGAGSFSGPGVSSSGMFDPSAAGDGTKTIRYNYAANNGCSNYAEQTIEVYPVPVANAGPDKTVLEGGEVSLTPVINVNYPVTYLWSPSAWLNSDEVLSPKSTPKDDITYTLKVTSDKGCSSSDNVFVKILRSPLVPNIFSPNGDGIHDRWEIPYLISYPGCTVEIYNRYGQLIYHSVGYDKPWDGTVNGNQVPVGTYYYIIDPKNGKQKMPGYVDVIR